MAERRILVIGGTGMVGANLVRHLVAQGAHPHVALRSGSDTIRLDDVMDRLQPLPMSLDDAASVAAAVRESRPEVVFHTASTPFSPPGAVSDETHFTVNAQGTQHLLAALAVQAPEARLIYTGSAAVYADGSHLREDRPLAPGSVYGAAKAAAAIMLGTYARLHKLATCELRLFTVYGPWERARRLVPHVVLSALQGRPVELATGHAQRDFLHVDDVVRALMLAAERPPAPGSAINICSGEGTAVRDIAAAILRLMGDPVPLRVGTAPPRPDEIWEISGDNALAARLLGWRPALSLEEGLSDMIGWCTAHRDLLPRLP